MNHLERVTIGMLAAAVCPPVTIGATLLIMGAVLEMPAVNFEAVMGAMIYIFVLGLPLSLTIVLIIALPAYLLFRRRWAMRWWHAALAGAVIGVAPSAAVAFDPTISALLGGAGLVSGLVFRAVVGRDPRLGDREPAS